MSKRDMKVCNNYREGVFKPENEPEEGEIVDEYDVIVSSDEEFSMRQRIRELEAENEEIEQIAVISRSYVDKINPLHTHLENSRAARVPTDASSISSTEFVTPKKRKRRKSREYRRKHCHHQHQHQHLHHHDEYEQHARYDQQQIPLKVRSRKTHCKRRQKLFARKHQKVHSDRYTYKELTTETVSLESLESSDSSSSLTDTDTYSKNTNRKEETFDYGKYISRDTLRLAVARNSNESHFSTKKSCLKDKLLRQELVGQSSNSAIPNDRLAVIDGGEVHDDNAEDDSDDDVQVIENEPDIQTVDEDSTDSMEEKELRLIALKSAVIKKHMARKMRNAEAAYSPTDFDEMLSSDILRQDNKLDDMEAVDLDGEECVAVSPVPSPQLMILEDQDESQQMVDCKPIDMDIANSDSEDTTFGSWSKDVEPAHPTFSLVSHDFANHFPYGYYMQELHELPPPPPGDDDYEEIPPPPPYHKMYTAQHMQDMELDNEPLVENQHWLESNDNYTRESMPSEPLPPSACHKEDVEDEEEEALRALLLSKFQSPKNQKKLKRPNDATECQDIISADQTHTKPIKPTEFILKEAVKRLKIHSQPGICKEESSGDFNNQGKFDSSIKPLECRENNRDSLTLLEKLRNRLNSYKNQSQSIKTDHLYQEENTGESEDEEKEDEHLEDTSENLNNYYEYDVSKEQQCSEAFSNASQLTNKIDISDITRRLQQIKENVLNSSHKQSTQLPLTNNLVLAPQVKHDFGLPDESFNVAENHKEEKEQQQPLLENVNKPLFDNNLDDIVATNIESNTNTTPTKDKTVEANFDATTNKTTFKVTISNSVAIKSEDINVLDKVADVSFKENNANNVSKNIKMKVNVNSKGKVALNSERLVKIINKTTETSAEVKAQVVKTSAVVKPIANKAQVTVVPKYSLLRTTKIVKPNKVINANFDLSRRQNSQATDSVSVPKPTRPEASNQLPRKADNMRLITSIDQVEHMLKVAPFIISVQNSSNESSGEEWSGECDSLYKPLYEYNDNASPLSLNLESPSRTPLRSNSPTDAAMDGNLKNSNLDTKLDVFLKETRASAPTATPQSNESDQCEKLNKTPLAVRHLPAAAQSEYRRLVHRMKLLENKRKSVSVDENHKVGNTDNNNDCTLSVKEELSKEKDKDKADATIATPKTSLVKKVLIRNATTTNESQTVVCGSTAATKFHKTNVLRSYENLYVKFGAGIVNNLDKSLKLVEEAKRAKVTKLKLETRLKELKAEMDILQSKHKEEQQKISRIYPSICTTNEVITSLKQKRSKVFKAALNLGKSLKGEDYRLNNDLKESITTKSKQLATEIKMVNSLKAQDINNLDEALTAPPTTTKELTVKDNKKKTVDEDCKTTPNPNPITDKIENKLSDTNDNTAMVCSDRANEKEEQTRLESPLKSDVGGNTEFQNMETHNARSPAKAEDSLPSNTDAKTDTMEVNKEPKETSTLPSYISPLEHLRNINSSMDPNGVVCPYDLMGNCEDVTCKYVHITPKVKT